MTTLSGRSANTSVGDEGHLLGATSYWVVVQPGRGDALCLLMEPGSNGRYWWLKLPLDFLDQPLIRLLRGQDDGDTYLIFLLRLMIASVRMGTPGSIQVPGGMGPAPRMLAIIGETNESLAEAALKRMVQMELVSVTDDDVLVLPDTLVGSEGTSAARVRRHRAKNKQIALQSNTSVTLQSDVEKRREEIEKEKKEDSMSGKPDRIPYQQIIEHLNRRAGTGFQHTTKVTQQHIRARWNEDWTIEAFRAVIDHKVSEWGPKPEMVQYLRPQTLFGTKFESYLEAAKREGFDGTD